jgi:hypothetical protein
MKHDPKTSDGWTFSIPSYNDPSFKKWAFADWLDANPRHQRTPIIIAELFRFSGMYFFSGDKIELFQIDRTP